MRNVVYLDKKIPKLEAETVFNDYAAFIKKHTGITPTFTHIERDFTDYPTVVDSDGDDIVRPDFLREIADDVEAAYGKYGTDNIITLIHQDNWKSGKTANRKGIWGTNYSYKYGNYHVQYCRWDKKNPTNTLNTIIHEQFHSYDALVKVEIGVDVNPILNVTAFDADVVHGGISSRFDYIGGAKAKTRNESALVLLAPYLKAAYAKRLEKHTEEIRGKQMTVISLLEKLVELWRVKINKKDGVPKK